MQRLLIQFTVLVVAVVGLSFIPSRLWGGKPEGLTEDRSLAVEDSMTVARAWPSQ